MDEVRVAIERGKSGRNLKAAVAWLKLSERESSKGEDERAEEVANFFLGGLLLRALLFLFGEACDEVRS